MKINSSNEERIESLENEREEFMFSCEQLLQLINVTPSVKTRLKFLEILKMIVFSQL